MPTATLASLMTLVLLSGSLESQAPLLGPLRRMLPPDSQSAREVLLADVDSDGDQDLLIAQEGGLDDRTRLYLNDGSGTFRDASGQLPPEAASTTEDLAIGDLDGDGLDDVFQVTLGGAMAHLWKGDGTGSFTTILSMPVANRRYELADVDGDQDLDLLGVTSLYLNGGTGSFTDASSQMPVVTLPSGFPSKLASGDVDADGDVDLVVAVDSFQFMQAWNLLLLNDGSGNFTDMSSQVPALSQQSRNVILTDVDGDGDPDVVVATRFGGSGSRNELWINDGAGNFTDGSLQMPSFGFIGSSDVAAVDVDGDGDQDLVLAHEESPSNDPLDAWPNRLLLNDGTGNFTELVGALPGTRRATRAIAAGDVDGDGDADLIFGNGGLDQDTLHLNDGQGQFLDVTGEIDVVRDGLPASVAIGDMDGDGDEDVLVGARYTQDVTRLLLNDGTGGLTDSGQTFPTGSGIIDDLELVDMNGDGALDVIAALQFERGSAAGRQNEFWLNDGTGQFIDGTFLLPQVMNQTTAVASGDVNGDGLPDLWFANRVKCTNLIWCTVAQDNLVLNLGNATMMAPLPPETDETMDVALGDVDGDGDLDAFVGNRDYTFFSGDDPRNRLLLNDGTGTFSVAPQFPVDQDDTEAVLLADIDGDGDLDAIAGNTGGPGTPQQDRLYLNDGSGFFIDATGQLPAIPTVTRDLVAADFDGDGDCDLFGATDTQNFLWTNDGSGNFIDATASLPYELARTPAVAVGDLTGNGLPDLYVGNQTADRLLAGLGATASWRGLPRFGQPIVIDLRGEPGAAWQLFGSPFTSSLAVPPVGTIYLDLNVLFDLGGGTLDPAGLGTLGFLFPPNPGGLSGLTVYVQGLIFGSPPRLTNLQPLTFLDY